MKITDMRCSLCRKLLAKTDGHTEIVCPRCGALNRYDPETGAIDCEPKEARQHNSSSGAMLRQRW